MFRTPFSTDCRPSERLYSSARMGNSRLKKSHNFQRLPLFSILYNDFPKFSENRGEEFKLGPRILILLVLETTSLAAH